MSQQICNWAFCTELQAPCTPLTCLSWEMFRKEPDDSGRQVGRVITRGDTDTNGHQYQHGPNQAKGQWIPTENPIQKSPCKGQQVCYCRVYTGRCCHVDQRLALMPGVGGGHSRVSQTTRDAEMSALLSHRGQRLRSAAPLVLPRWCTSIAV